MNYKYQKHKKYRPEFVGGSSVGRIGVGVVGVDGNKKYFLIFNILLTSYMCVKSCNEKGLNAYGYSTLK